MLNRKEEKTDKFGKPNGKYPTVTSDVERESILDELSGEGNEVFKIGVLDCETTGLWADFGYLLCAVIKNVSTGEYDVFRLDETKSYQNKTFRQDPKNWRRIDKELLEKFRKVYETYDIIVHYNGRYFDIQFLDTRLIKNHLPTLPDMKQIDILNDVIRKKMRIRSSRLDAVKEFLEIDEKEDGHAWEYWQMAANGMKEGFDYVVHHCKRDVDRLGEVTKRVKSQIRIIGKW
jgi:uncharacterized protein YprB with RNaseH-like and TPR domain